MLEVKGELVFKTVAYHRAADAIGRSPVDLVAAYRAGKPPRIPGVGAAISDKIAELATTGRMAFYDRLRAEIPPGLVELLRIPGVGPKTVRQLHDELGIEIDRRPAARRRGGPAARPPRPVGEDRGARSSRASPGSTPTPAGCSSTARRDARRRAHRGARGHARRAPARAGRLVPPPPRDDRRPRPARRDRRRRRRSSSGSRPRRRRPRRQPGRLQGRGPPAARARRST